MPQDSQKPQESAPVFLLLFVGFIIGLCVGFMTKDYVVKAMIGMMPKAATQTDLPPIDPNEAPLTPEVLTPELPTTPPGQDVAPTTTAPEGEDATEEKKAEEEKEVAPEGIAPVTPAEPAPAADIPPATAAPVAE